MIIYLLVALLSLYLMYIYDIVGKQKYANVAYFFLFIVIVNVAGLRYEIGTDSIMYEKEYELYPSLLDFRKTTDLPSRYSIGWIVFCAFCKMFSPSFFFMQYIHACLINAAFFWFFRKNTKYIFTAVFLYYTLGFLYYNTEIMRQSMAVGIFLLATQYYYKHKWIKYYVMIAVAMLFHASAMILCLFPLVHIKKLTKINILMLFILLIFSLFSFRYLNPFMTAISSMFNVEEQAAYYMEGKRNNVSLFTLIYLCKYCIIPIFCIYYGVCKIRGMKNYENSSLVWLYCMFGGLQLCSLIVFLRFQDYLFFSYIVYLVTLFRNKNIDRSIVVMAFMIIIVSCYMPYFGSEYKIYIGEFGFFYERYIPYSSILENI